MSGVSTATAAQNDADAHDTWKGVLTPGTTPVEADADQPEPAADATGAAVSTTPAVTTIRPNASAARTRCAPWWLRAPAVE
jgi:hypothetical protein